MNELTPPVLDWTTAPAFGRTEALKKTLALLSERLPQERDFNIVEVGTAYRYDLNELGNAILAFAWFASTFGGKVYIFDPLQPSIKSAQDILRQHGKPHACIDHCFWFQMSGWKIREVLPPNLRIPIDLIYLDAFIGPTNHNVCKEPNTDKNEWYDELYTRIKHLFVPGSLLLIDDTNPTNFDGKGCTLIPRLLRDGDWRRIGPEEGFPAAAAMVLMEKRSHGEGGD